MDSGKTGAPIAEARKEKGFTQRQLTETLHLSDRTVSKWERGAGFPDVALLEPLADALGLTVRSLLRGEAEPPEEKNAVSIFCPFLCREPMCLFWMSRPITWIYRH